MYIYIIFRPFQQHGHATKLPGQKFVDLSENSWWITKPTTLVMSSDTSDDGDDDASAHSNDNQPLVPPLEVAAEPEDDCFIDNYAINDEHDHSLSEQIVHYVGGYVQREHGQPARQPSHFMLVLSIANQW